MLIKSLYNTLCLTPVPAFPDFSRNHHSRITMVAARTLVRRATMGLVPRTLSAWATIIVCLSIAGIDGPAVEAFSVHTVLLQKPAPAFTRGTNMNTNMNPHHLCLSWYPPPTAAGRQSTLLYLKMPGGGKKKSEDDEDPDDRELVPVRRRKGSSRYYDQDDDGEANAYDNKESKYYDDDEVMDDEDWEEDEDDDWEEGDDDEISNDDYDYLFEDTIIPNPLLDSMDPDGAADRFPELARDPRFWFDMCLFIAFLNFLSSAGPRDPFPDIPWY
jgi:hypothetical protein